MIIPLHEADAVPYDLLLMADPSKEMVDHYLELGSSYVLKEDGQIIGVYIVTALNKTTVEIVNIAVAKSHQGQGHAKKLIFHARDLAKEQGYHTLEIGTGNASIDQLALYQKCGFRISGVRRNYFVRHYDEAIYENGIQVMDMVRLSMNIV